MKLFIFILFLFYCYNNDIDESLLICEENEYEKEIDHTYEDVNDLNTCDSSLPLIKRNEIEKIVLVTTLSGNIHAINPENGDEIWKFNSGNPLLQSYQVSENSKLYLLYYLVMLLFHQLMGEL